MGKPAKITAQEKKAAKEALAKEKAAEKDKTDEQKTNEHKTEEDKTNENKTEEHKAVETPTVVEPETPIKQENPLMKRKFTIATGATKKAPRYENSINVYHVQTRDPEMSVVGITCSGYAERIMTQPLFDREEADNATFIKDTGVYGHVFIKTDADGKPEKNNKNYDVKLLLVGISAGVLTKAFIDDYVTTTFIPAIDNLNLLKASSLPKYDPTTNFHVVETWTEIMSIGDALTVWRNVFCEKGKCYQFGHFVKNTKERVYSMFQAGKVKPQFCIKQQIGPDDLEGEDKTTLNQFLAARAHLEQQEN